MKVGVERGEARQEEQKNRKGKEKKDEWNERMKEREMKILKGKGEGVEGSKVKSEFNVKNER